MSGNFRRKMDGLHAWGGLIAGWLLFAVFLTGTISYFRQEISLWMRPELPSVASRSVDPAASAVMAVAWARENAIGAARWLIVPADERSSTSEVWAWWDDGTKPAFRKAMLDGVTGRPVFPRQTMGGDFLYYFHFDLNAPGIWGRLAVGVVSVIMLAAIVSGVIVHRRIFKDFFAFRTEHSPQRAWLDAHNVSGVLALPYHLMITYSGLVTLMFLYIPWGMLVSYDGKPARYYAEAGIVRPIPPRSGAVAPLVPLAPLLAEATRQWQGLHPGRIDVYRPGDGAALVDVAPSDEQTILYLSNRLLFDGVTGAQRVQEPTGGAAADTRAALYGLHIARFAGPGLRWLFFLSGLAGSAMVGTGLVLWLKKRRARNLDRSTFGHNVVAALNTATLVGLPIAIAGLFWANRLLPVDAPGRMEREGVIFYAVWAACLFYAAVRPAASAWRELLAAAALLFLSLPVLNEATTERGLLASLPAEDWPLAGVDLGFLAVGVLFVALTITSTVRSGASKEKVIRKTVAAEASR